MRDSQGAVAQGASPWHRLRALVEPREVGAVTLLVGCALYLALGLNGAFWHQVQLGLASGFPLQNASIVLSLFLALCTLLIFAALPFSSRHVLRPFLAIALLVGAGCDYFMGAYGVVIDAPMVDNLLQTDPREARELMSLRLAAHVLLFGLVPAAIVLRLRLKAESVPAAILRRAALAAVVLVATVTSVVTTYKSVSLWVRQHRSVRLYVNPTYPAYAVVRSLRGRGPAAPAHPEPIATDAVRVASASGKPRVVVMVVGETARARNYSLLGYGRDTNPEMEAVPGVVAINLQSCGTATAISVPCMFSSLGRAHFSRRQARAQENLLDVLQRTGVDVSWRDNNSDCKGVCARVPTQDLRHAGIDGLCDQEGCRDEVLLQGLDEQISKPGGDRLIVLHLLGSHGPSYFRRYPAAYRRFQPECAQDDVQDCSRESIVNAYDNSILYTDHVLARIVGLLERHHDQVEPTMLYVSDHGESLGEGGLYLHGLPYALAPDDQTHVPMLAWSPRLEKRAAPPAQASQDDVFHTVLGLFTIRTSAYRAQADLLRRI